MPRSKVARIGSSSIGRSCLKRGELRELERSAEHRLPAGTQDDVARLQRAARDLHILSNAQQCGNGLREHGQVELAVGSQHQLGPVK